MAIGIHNDGIYTIYEAPLMTFTRPEYNVGNEWLISHLRDMADIIQDEKLDIIKIGFDWDIDYKAPKLRITAFKKTTPTP